MISSGDIPDVFPTFGPGDQDYENLAKEDLLMDLTDMISKYPNLQKRTEVDALKYFKTNGKLYGFPRNMNDIPAHALYIRQDWLEKLNLQEPKTFDDLYAVLKEFVKNDPDGQKATGLSVDGSWWFYFITTAYTGLMDWGVKDGRYVNFAVDPGYKEALKYLNKMYKEKLLDPDFMLGKDKNSFDKFMSGRAGVIYQGFQAHEYGPAEEGLKKNFPNAKIKLVIPPLTGPAGGFSLKQATPYFGMTHFKKDAKNPERLLEVMDYLASDEGVNLLRYGIEGVHYTKDGDKLVRNDAEYEKDRFNFGSSKTHTLTMLVGFDHTYWFPEHLPYNKIVGDGIEKLRSTGLESKVYGFSSENNTKMAPAMQDIFAKYQAKFITGELDIDKGWDEYLQKYNEAGYTTVEKETNDYMARFK
jgi:ABC-type glycerol-3-phosphate transport system substrate-binding protein